MHLESQTCAESNRENIWFILNCQTGQYPGAFRTEFNSIAQSCSRDHVLHLFSQHGAL